MKGKQKAQVKICGIRLHETLPVLVAEQPEYVGFVFAPSKRKVSPETAADLGKSLPDTIQKVGVFMNEEEETLKNIAVQACLDILQLHGQESPDYCLRLRRAGFQIWKAFSLKTREDLLRLRAYQVDGYLVDAAGAGGAGGTGTIFPWHWLENDELIKEKYHPLILAGGLHPGNIQRALTQTSPDVVDVSSGVETDGTKDPQLIRHFIQKVRNEHVHEPGTSP